jgi:hypothetical protein
LTVDACIREPAPQVTWPYRPSPEGVVDETPETSVSVEALPFFAWGNRGGDGMRVWLPTCRAGRGDRP